MCRLIAVLIVLLIAGCQERAAVDSSRSSAGTSENSRFADKTSIYDQVNSELSDVQLGPLAESLDAMKARMKAHDELAKELVDQTTIGEWTGLLSFVSNLLTKVKTDDEHMLLMESIGFDYYDDLGQWQRGLSEHAKRLLPQGQSKLLTEAGYICKAQLKVGHGAHIVDEPRGVMAPAIEQALGILHAECSMEAPKSEQAIWVSHATVTGRAFDGTTEFYMIEFVWHRMPDAETK